MLKGFCLCGDITFQVKGTAKGASMCHCGQCRKLSGGIWASAHLPETEIDIDGPVHWFEASPSAKRGFCPRFGAFLFWKAHDEEEISFALGAIDGPTGLPIEKHIFVADKGDYYAISDDVPQEE